MKKFKDIRSFFKKTNKQPDGASQSTSTLQPDLEPEENNTVSQTISLASNSEKSRQTKTPNGPEQFKENHNIDGPKSDLAVAPMRSSPLPHTLSSCSLQEIGQEEHLGNLQTGPSRPVINYPKTKFGDRYRSFSSKFYDVYSWVEYSLKNDKIYCFICRNFCKNKIRYQNEKFVASGFSNWKKLSDALLKHEHSTIHIQFTEMYIAYKQTLVAGSVHEKLVSQHSEEVTQNRAYLLKIIEVILCLARQGLALRGHREDNTSHNRGNFREICELFSKYDDNFYKHLEKHTSYCSPKIQNEFIEIIAQLTLQEIVNEVKQCGFFSLMADEAKSYKQEQLSIVIRYAKGLNVEERFLCFIDCSTSRDADGLAKLILDTFKNCDLNNIPIIAQSYDGAGVMSGKYHGLQAVIRESYPEAVYMLYTVYCLAHR